ncbi:MAG: cobalamin-independent methionine synthase II family protein [SAR202 cluster bacterium]|nr:cobalamin-independent methionine synthase II family protein [SAR202 cluster bacterium]MQG68603.1 cobalamin-independent methionine synthase II family protein [SAR202 cluster bacterium]
MRFSDRGRIEMTQQYRADHIGSLLRPEGVKKARRDYLEGRIGRGRLVEAEDRAILDALDRQRHIGLDVYTDGEFRRSSFQNDLAESIEGYVESEKPSVVRIWRGPGGDPQEQGTNLVVGGKLKQARRLTDAQTAFLKQNAPGPIKMTVPSPNQFPAISFQPGVTDQFYATRSDLLWEIVNIIKAEISNLAQEGVPYIQIDAPRYSYFVDDTWRRHLEDLGQDPEKAFEEAVDADNACLEGAQREGATFAMHICRGNNQSKWYAQGGYEPIAERLFGSLNVDRFLLEFDTERAGSFEPLRFIPDGKMIGLGLVSSKDPTLEDQDALLRRIDEAARYVPVERLSLSPQCGFASTEAGNLLTEDEQWRKLELVVETARKIWG